MSTVIDQNSIEADDTEVSRASLLREASREGEGVIRRAHSRLNWMKNMHVCTLASNISTFDS